MNIVAVIPARMGSSRFPGKPMENIHNVPMVGHVYFRTRLSELLTDTYVATCDQVIYDYIINVGGKAVMTSNEHEHCSDRCSEAMSKIESMTDKKIDIVVMVQGDEPMVTPEMIDSSVRPLIDNPAINIVNLMAKIKTIEEFEDPNEVKVVVDSKNNALYFSREPVPSRKKGVDDVPMLKQVCIIPFRRDYLLKFNSMPESPMEKIESVDMLRVLENGDNVQMVMTDADTLSVDTLEELHRVSEMMKLDPLIPKYK